MSGRWQLRCLGPSGHELFDRLNQRHDALEAAIQMEMSAHRLFVLMMVYDGPISARELASAVRTLEPSPLFTLLRRLRRDDTASRYLHGLAKRDVLQRTDRNGTTKFALRRGVRAKLRPVLDPLMRTGE